MGDRTGIEWTDATWNPVTGCDEVTPGCDHCYAKTLAERFRGTPGHYYEHGFDVTLRPDKLDLPLRWTKPKMIFVNSMSDLFHKDVPDEYIARVFAAMALAGQHTFQLLTKRHGRMRSLLNSDSFLDLFGEAVYTIEHPTGEETAEPITTWPLPNVWLGVSVEDQDRALLRVPALLETPAAVRFLSCEPLLGPVDLTHMDVERHSQSMYWINALTGRNTDMGRPCADVPTVDWVIAGGESGHGARPMHPGWVRSLRDQCATAGVPFLFKQWGEWLPTVTGDHRVRYDGEFYPSPGSCLMSNEELVARVGKKAAGRMLDGRTHDEYPEVAHA
jgi:protein gp37